MQITLEALTKSFDGVVAVDDVELDISSGEFLALLGPSGCGKTTTLLTVAGIYQPSSGAVRFDGRDVSGLPPKARNLGMVFQSYALYPHMTAYENMIFPLRLQKIPEADRRRRAQRVAELLDIAELLERRPAQLSGGQQQRVALGRALIKEPDALLFDEPLSNLDAGLRLTMRTEIKKLQKELRITSIFVTHDQVEAMTMADRIGIMRAGRLESLASPEDTYDRPRTRFVAAFVGSPPMNFVELEVTEASGRFVARRPGLELEISSERGARAAGRGPVVLGVRPEDLSVNGHGTRGRVVTIEPLGREDLLVVDVEGVELRALVDPSARLRPGDVAGLTLEGAKAQFFEVSSGRSLLWT
ncbi:MAG: ABC transporter ATP-binding protein [Actinomycetota bacterium]